MGGPFSGSHGLRKEKDATSGNPPHGDEPQDSSDAIYSAPSSGNMDWPDRIPSVSGNTSIPDDVEKLDVAVGSAAGELVDESESDMYSAEETVSMDSSNGDYPAEGLLSTPPAAVQDYGEEPHGETTLPSSDMVEPDPVSTASEQAVDMPASGARPDATTEEFDLQTAPNASEVTQNDLFDSPDDSPSMNEVEQGVPRRLSLKRPAPFRPDDRFLFSLLCNWTVPNTKTRSTTYMDVQGEVFLFHGIYSVKGFDHAEGRVAFTRMRDFQVTAVLDVPPLPNDSSRAPGPYEFIASVDRSHIRHEATTPVVHMIRDVGLYKEDGDYHLCIVISTFDCSQYKFAAKYSRPPPLVDSFKYHRVSSYSCCDPLSLSFDDIRIPRISDERRNTGSSSTESNRPMGVKSPSHAQDYNYGVYSPQARGGHSFGPATSLVNCTLGLVLPVVDGVIRPTLRNLVSGEGVYEYDHTLVKQGSQMSFAFRNLIMRTLLKIQPTSGADCALDVAGNSIPIELCCTSGSRKDDVQLLCMTCAFMKELLTGGSLIPMKEFNKRGSLVIRKSKKDSTYMRLNALVPFVQGAAREKGSPPPRTQAADDPEEVEMHYTPSASSLMLTSTDGDVDIVSRRRRGRPRGSKRTAGNGSSSSLSNVDAGNTSEDSKDGSDLDYPIKHSRVTPRRSSRLTGISPDSTYDKQAADATPTAPRRRTRSRRSEQSTVSSRRKRRSLSSSKTVDSPKSESPPTSPSRKNSIDVGDLTDDSSVSNTPQREAGDSATGINTAANDEDEKGRDLSLFEEGTEHIEASDDHPIVNTDAGYQSSDSVGGSPPKKKFRPEHASGNIVDDGKTRHQTEVAPKSSGVGLYRTSHGPRMKRTESVPNSADDAPSPRGRRYGDFNKSASANAMDGDKRSNRGVVAQSRLRKAMPRQGRRSDPPPGDSSASLGNASKGESELPKSAFGAPLDIFDEYDGFDYIGYCVRYRKIITTKVPAKGRESKKQQVVENPWRVAVIKFWDPKWHVFFVHHLKEEFCLDLKGNLSNLFKSKSLDEVLDSTAVWIETCTFDVYLMNCNKVFHPSGWFPMGAPVTEASESTGERANESVVVDVKTEECDDVDSDVTHQGLQSTDALTADANANANATQPTLEEKSEQSATTWSSSGQFDDNLAVSVDLNISLPSYQLPSQYSCDEDPVDGSLAPTSTLSDMDVDTGDTSDYTTQANSSDQLWPSEAIAVDAPAQTSDPDASTPQEGHVVCSICNEKISRFYDELETEGARKSVTNADDTLSLADLLHSLLGIMEHPNAAFNSPIHTQSAAVYDIGYLEEKQVYYLIKENMDIANLVMGNTFPDGIRSCNRLITALCVKLIVWLRYVCGYKNKVTSNTQFKVVYWGLRCSDCGKACHARCLPYFHLTKGPPWADPEHIKRRYAHHSYMCRLYGTFAVMRPGLTPMNHYRADYDPCDDISEEDATTSSAFPRKLSPEVPSEWYEEHYDPKYASSRSMRPSRQRRPAGKPAPNRGTSAPVEHNDVKMEDSKSPVHSVLQEDSPSNATSEVQTATPPARVKLEYENYPESNESVGLPLSLSDLMSDVREEPDKPVISSPAAVEATGDGSPTQSSPVTGMCVNAADAPSCSSLQLDDVSFEEPPILLVPYLQHGDRQPWKCDECTVCMYCCEKVTVSEEDENQTPCSMAIMNTSRRSNYDLLYPPSLSEKLERLNMKTKGRPLIDFVRCVSCNVAAHKACCNPAIPDLSFLESWRCEACLQCICCGYRDSAEPDYMNWGLFFLFCLRCWQAFEKNNYCGVCYRIWTPLDNVSYHWMQCDTCKLWVHLECDRLALELSMSGSNKHRKYTCLICRNPNKLHRIFRVLELVFNTERSGNFRYPMPRTCTVYWRLVKCPMDLITIRNKVECGQYKTVEDFVFDVMVISHNTKTVNMPNTKVYRNAINFEVRCKQLLCSILGISDNDIASILKRGLNRVSFEMLRNKMTKHVGDADMIDQDQKGLGDSSLNLEDLDYFMNGDGTGEFDIDVVSAKLNAHRKSHIARLRYYQQMQAKRLENSLKFLDEHHLITHLGCPDFFFDANVVEKMFPVPVTPCGLDYPMLNAISPVNAPRFRFSISDSRKEDLERLVKSKTLYLFDSTMVQGRYDSEVLHVSDRCFMDALRALCTDAALYTDGIWLEFCVACGSSAFPSYMIFCHSCGEAFHYYCVGFIFPPPFADYSNFFCANCAFCDTCTCRMVGNHLYDLSNVNDFKFAHALGWIPGLLNSTSFKLAKALHNSMGCGRSAEAYRRRMELGLGYVFVSPADKKNQQEAERTEPDQPRATDASRLLGETYSQRLATNVDNIRKDAPANRQSKGANDEVMRPCAFFADYNYPVYGVRCVFCGVALHYKCLMEQVKNSPHAPIGAGNPVKSVSNKANSPVGYNPGESEIDLRAVSCQLPAGRSVTAPVAFMPNEVPSMARVPEYPPTSSISMRVDDGLQVASRNLVQVLPPQPNVLPPAPVGQMEYAVVRADFGAQPQTNFPRRISCGQPENLAMSEPAGSYGRRIYETQGHAYGESLDERATRSADRVSFLKMAPMQSSNAYGGNEVRRSYDYSPNSRNYVSSPRDDYIAMEDPPLGGDDVGKWNADKGVITGLPVDVDRKGDVLADSAAQTPIKVEGSERVGVGAQPHTCPSLSSGRDRPPDFEHTEDATPSRTSKFKSDGTLDWDEGDAVEFKTPTAPQLRPVDARPTGLSAAASIQRAYPYPMVDNATSTPPKDFPCHDVGGVRGDKPAAATWDCRMAAGATVANSSAPMVSNIQSMRDGGVYSGERSMRTASGGYLGPQTATNPTVNRFSNDPADSAQPPRKNLAATWAPGDFNKPVSYVEFAHEDFGTIPSVAAKGNSVETEVVSWNFDGTGMFTCRDDVKRDRESMSRNFHYPHQGLFVLSRLPEEDLLLRNLLKFDKEAASGGDMQAESDKMGYIDFSHMQQCNVSGVHYSVTLNSKCVCCGVPVQISSGLPDNVADPNGRAMVIDRASPIELGSHMGRYVICAKCKAWRVALKFDGPTLNPRDFLNSFESEDSAGSLFNQTEGGLRKQDEIRLLGSNAIIKAVALVRNWQLFSQNLVKYVGVILMHHMLLHPNPPRPIKTRPSLIAALVSRFLTEEPCRGPLARGRLYSAMAHSPFSPISFLFWADSLRNSDPYDPEIDELFNKVPREFGNLATRSNPMGMPLGPEFNPMPQLNTGLGPMAAIPKGLPLGPTMLLPHPYLEEGAAVPNQTMDGASMPMQSIMLPALVLSNPISPGAYVQPAGGNTLFVDPSAMAQRPVIGTNFDGSNQLHADPRGGVTYISRSDPNQGLNNPIATPPPRQGSASAGPLYGTTTPTSIPYLTYVGGAQMPAPQIGVPITSVGFGGNVDVPLATSVLPGDAVGSVPVLVLTPLTTILPGGAMVAGGVTPGSNVGPYMVPLPQPNMGHAPAAVMQPGGESGVNLCNEPPYAVRTPNFLDSSRMSFDRDVRPPEIHSAPAHLGSYDGVNAPASMPLPLSYSHGSDNMLAAPTPLFPMMSNIDPSPPFWRSKLLSWYVKVLLESNHLVFTYKQIKQTDTNMTDFVFPKPSLNFIDASMGTLGAFYNLRGGWLRFVDYFLQGIRRGYTQSQVGGHPYLRRHIAHIFFTTRHGWEEVHARASELSALMGVRPTLPRLSTLPYVVYNVSFEASTIIWLYHLCKEFVENGDLVMIVNQCSASLDATGCPRLSARSMYLNHYVMVEQSENTEDLHTKSISYANTSYQGGQQQAADPQFNAFKDTSRNMAFRETNLKPLFRYVDKTKDHLDAAFGAKTINVLHGKGLDAWIRLGTSLIVETVSGRAMCGDIDTESFGASAHTRCICDSTVASLSDYSSFEGFGLGDGVNEGAYDVRVKLRNLHLMENIITRRVITRKTAGRVHHTIASDENTACALCNVSFSTLLRGTLLPWRDGYVHSECLLWSLDNAYLPRTYNQHFDTLFLSSCVLKNYLFGIQPKDIYSSMPHRRSRNAYSPYRDGHSVGSSGVESDSLLFNFNLHELHVLPPVTLPDNLVHIVVTTARSAYCAWCREPGATVGCTGTKCEVKFHVTCAFLAANTQMTERLLQLRRESGRRQDTAREIFPVRIYYTRRLLWCATCFHEGVASKLDPTAIGYLIKMNPTQMKTFLALEGLSSSATLISCRQVLQSVRIVPQVIQHCSIDEFFEDSTHYYAVLQAEFNRRLSMMTNDETVPFLLDSIMKPQRSVQSAPLSDILWNKKKRKSCKCNNARLRSPKHYFSFAFCASSVSPFNTLRIPSNERQPTAHFTTNYGLQHNAYFTATKAESGGYSPTGTFTSSGSLVVSFTEGDKRSYQIEDDASELFQHKRVRSDEYHDRTTPIPEGLDGVAGFARLPDNTAEQDRDADVRQEANAGNEIVCERIPQSTSPPGPTLKLRHDPLAHLAFMRQWKLHKLRNAAKSVGKHSSRTSGSYNGTGDAEVGVQLVKRVTPLTSSTNNSAPAASVPPRDLQVHDEGAHMGSDVAAPEPELSYNSATSSETASGSTDVDELVDAFEIENDITESEPLSHPTVTGAPVASGHPTSVATAPPVVEAAEMRVTPTGRLSEHSLPRFGAVTILSVGDGLIFDKGHTAYPAGYTATRIFWNAKQNTLRDPKSRNLTGVCNSSSISCGAPEARSCYLCTVRVRQGMAFFAIGVLVGHEDKEGCKWIAQGYDLDAVFVLFLQEVSVFYTRRFSGADFFGLNSHYVVQELRVRMCKTLLERSSSFFNTRVFHTAMVGQSFSKSENKLRPMNRYGDSAPLEESTGEVVLIDEIISVIDFTGDHPVRLDACEPQLLRARRRRQFGLAIPLTQRRYISNLYAEKRLDVRNSPIHGFGLFVTDEIAAGEPVVEYVGELIRDLVADRREDVYSNEQGGDGSCYMFRLDDQLIVDATRRGSMSRFINHSCEPNCFCRVVICENNLKHIVIYAKFDLKAGDEVTYDYQFGVEDEAQRLRCHCNSANCMGRMN
ncbi:homolog of Putative histone-lysine N-methyltransferase PFF1440w [Babesia bigemina]|uniref:Homolog of Putative histone-lysine N-methyltransferase PFF1440w n=1 Tax=Babesia bigemina TaxID=5866 RepID=A0A061DA06_BABBI|nr:homolog of Putative histone-lysine N-methyltransferase PFF1440w [Babesia bigemina]CDR97348.1 homolog of Putative histone-lysine N-methyltransferase PFF1440w [Babesia bigemina]|eukprot:XP_012769534.1 homolog of Putative histone-lysine N-methyltransferase PFF1440w [Babesia bigemina]